MTNRFDIHKQLEAQGLDAKFSDYDFSNIEDKSIAQAVYRVSKERPVVHHIANQALRILKPGGQLIIAGEKGEGTKGYIDKISKLYGNKTPAQKNGSAYMASITKTNDYEDLKSEGKLLDDKDYPTLREVTELPNQKAIKIWSKPGQFGWNKLDQGSILLMDTATRYFSANSYPDSVVDLGCGYGFLTLNTHDWPTKTRTATDNNAAAVASANHNFLLANMQVDVVADDCGANIQRTFDCVLCNPPFHQGFNNDSDLTDKFLESARRLTSTCGVALFVVNQFIGLEKRAISLFGAQQTLASDGQFKVIALFP